MASTISEKYNEPSVGGGGDDLGNLFGDGGDGGGGRPIEPERTPTPDGYLIAVWLSIVSITALFLALTALYLFNRAGSQPIITPQILWASTGLILTSSLTMEFARRALKKRSEDRFRFWIYTTLVLGICFLTAQIFVWRQLLESGFYVNKNFRSGYTYIFTGLHAVHLMGGLFAVAFVAFRPVERWTALRRRVSVDASAIYWHFLDGLWLFLFVLIFLWS